jgi:hypothetical protein
MEMKNIKYYITIILSVSLFSDLSAREIMGKPRRVAQNQRLLAGCDEPIAKTDLDINNVRTTIFTGSDMWWDLVTEPRYEVPKNSKKHSLFAGAIWIGGVDAGKNLKVAAQTYRQQAEFDWWTGPLDTTGNITKEECLRYDKHYVVTRKEVEVFVGSGVSTPAIESWPGNADVTKGQDLYLAPFFDANGDGLYTPSAGDYPNFNLGKPDNKKGYLLGDKVLWWVFNDKGNVHTATKPSKPIGIEVQAQAFAFENKPGDPISNMTFYQYKIINKSSTAIDSTWFGQWVDPDLGKYDDDYVGCDVQRGLGYCYNGDPDDEGPKGYGLNPPAIGVDFFEGPQADSLDGVDNDRDGAIDEAGELIIMSQFVYFNNDFTPTGNPANGLDFYNYLRGIWKDGIHMTYGGNGKGSGPGATTTPCNFMFPDNTDPSFATPWTEVTAGNVAADRRFIQSAGAFTLNPGAVNYITTGVVWAKAPTGGPLASVELLKAVDDQAQSLFDNNFNKLRGPDAPDMALRELDKEVILTISNNSLSNNIKESYKERDQKLFITDDTNYVFQGYQIFQLKDVSVLGSYLDPETNVLDPDKARIVAQCDIQDDVTQIYNFRGVDYDTTSQFVGTAMVYQAEAPNDFFNKGIRHTFRVTKDYFTNERLVNNKTYYYTVVAYAFNKAETRNPKVSLEGSYTPYVSGSRNSKVYLAVPHMVAPENGGQVLNSVYGSSPKITRVSGNGNGGNEVDIIMNDAIFNKYLKNPPYKLDSITYDYGKGPLGIKVVDPVAVPKGNFSLAFDSVKSGARWTLVNETTGLTIKADTTIGTNYEQVIQKWGLSVTIAQIKDPLVDKQNNPITGSQIQFADSLNKWLGGVIDNEASSFLFNESGQFTDNWIRVGVGRGDISSIDPKQYLEGVLGGTWAPYGAVSDSVNDAYPASISVSGQLSSSGRRNLNLNSMASVLLVITQDKEKWTRSPVVETHAIPSEVNSVTKLALKDKTPSVGKDGQPDNTGNGMGWFPGYAVNMETGERLNIVFGEDSYLTSENGNDMIWNPTTSYISPSGEYLLGGKHFIYIMNHISDAEVPAYDEGKYIADALKASPNPRKKADVFKHAIWTTVPVLTSTAYSFNVNVPPGDVRIRLSVAKPYRKGSTPLDSVNGANPRYFFSTDELYNNMNNKDVAKDAMDLIRVVPNPYYAHSDYEAQQFENKVKITNLPPKCTISIFTVNGSLVRTISKENSGDTSMGADKEERDAIISNAIEWDLKNSRGIPISSGMYIFHIQSEGLPDKVIKWFGVVRPIDLSNY